MKNIENMYEQLATALIALADSDWNTLRVSAPVLGDCCGGIEISSVTNAGEKKWLKPTTQAISIINKTFLGIRDELRGRSGTRIWSIDFDLRNDGKMLAKFGYEKPDWYDDPDDSQEGSRLPETSAPSTVDFPHLTSDESIAFRWLQEVTATNLEKFGIGEALQWHLDMSRGEIAWDIPPSRVLVGSIQVLGTHRIDTHDFLWSWGNPSVPERLTMAASKLGDLGQQLGIRELTERSVIVDEIKVLAWAGMAAKGSELDGVYRVRSNDTWIYLLYSNVQEQKGFTTNRRSNRALQILRAGAQGRQVDRLAP